MRLIKRRRQVGFDDVRVAQLASRLAEAEAGLLRTLAVELAVDEHAASLGSIPGSLVRLQVRRDAIHARLSLLRPLLRDGGDRSAPSWLVHEVNALIDRVARLERTASWLLQEQWLTDLGDAG